MNKNVVITGGNRGIGLEFVRQMLDKGWKVLATARSPQSASELMELREKNPQSLFIAKVDLEEEAHIAGLGGQVSQHFEHLDLLINNAGVYLDSSQQTLDQLQPEMLKRSFQINTLGPLLVTKSLLPLLQKSKAAKIVHITSQMGSIEDNTSGGAYSYRMSKAALNMFNKSLSLELKKIPCVVLHPGWVQTEMGGKNASITPQQSVEGLLVCIEKMSMETSGKFYNYKGEEIPW